MTYIPGGGGGVSDGDKGDIVVASSGTSWTFDSAVVTAFAKTILDDANAAAARSTLGVTGTGADTAYAFRANNLSDLASASTARSNLGLVIGTDVLGMGGGTLTGDLSVPDEAYDATTWNGNNEVATKNAIRDKFESLSSGLAKVSTYATDSQATTADTQYVPKQGSAPSATANSANNMTVTFTVASSQDVIFMFQASGQRGSAGRHRFTIRDTTGALVWPAGQSLYSVLAPEGSPAHQSINFIGVIPVTAGTYTWQVRADYALTTDNFTFTQRNMAVLYTP